MRGFLINARARRGGGNGGSAAVGLSVGLMDSDRGKFNGRWNLFFRSIIGAFFRME